MHLIFSRDNAESMFRVYMNNVEVFNFTYDAAAAYSNVPMFPEGAYMQVGEPTECRFSQYSSLFYQVSCFMVILYVCPVRFY